MLKLLLVSFFTTGELSVLSQRIIKIVLTIVDEPFIMEIIGLLQKDVELLQKTRDIIRKSKHTPELQMKKELRNDALDGLKDFCKACVKKHKTETYHKSAVELYTLLKEYKSSVSGKGTIEQTDGIHRLIHDLSEMKKQIQTINAKEWVEDLIGAQEAFESYYHLKVEAEKEEGVPQISDLVNSLKKHLHALIVNLDIVAELRPEKLSEIEPKISEYISDTMTTARARKTRKGNEKDESNETQQQTA